jgi:hypothetical protein
MVWLHIFALLVAGHFLADYPLQGEFLAFQKDPWLDPSKRIIPWPHALGVHAAIHAGMVLLVTSSLVLAGLELIAHTATDMAKCAGKISYDQDQAIHFGCKILWLTILAVNVGALS